MTSYNQCILPRRRFQSVSSISVILVVLFVLIACVCQNTVGEWKAIDSPCLCQQFRCNSSSICLHAERVCDGVRDCPDGEDEINSLTSNPEGKCNRQEQKNLKCSEKEFRCKFGGCILYEQVCDGAIDCYGAVEEGKDLCEWVHST